MTSLSLVIEPDELEASLDNPDLLIIDMCKPSLYMQFHIPGAVHLDYSKIVRAENPVMGLLPDISTLNAVLSSIGFNNHQHVVAYDDEGGGKACRLLWTLAACGYEKLSLLNGGFLAWVNEKHPMSQQIPSIEPTHSNVSYSNENAIADRDYILSQLDNTDTKRLDVRTIEEFNGLKRLADKAGHIPGAVNMDWMLTMDQQNNLRFRPENELRAMLVEREITPDKEIIVYCQSHHRSAHTWIMLKSLGFERVRGYHGSWSDWGNHPDTPVE
ncbi:MAG: sulfurtransferase [Gammaproteobacteria bacterium]|nr:sulfurtransferase [Gammaproteobacteria bacterium]